MKRIISFLVCALLVLSSSLAFASPVTYTADMQRQADAGDVEAIMIVGYAYAFGDGIRQDYHKANQYWLKAISHPNWSSIDAGIRGEVYCNLGKNYYEGQGVRQDYHKAAEYLRKAANLGNAQALHNLGVYYAEGKGIRQDYHKAVEYYKKAADLGHAEAMGNLGVCYVLGQGVRQDKRMAKEYFGMACDHGHQKGCDGYRMMKEEGY